MLWLNVRLGQIVCPDKALKSPEAMQSRIVSYISGYMAGLVQLIRTLIWVNNVAIRETLLTCTVFA